MSGDSGVRGVKSYRDMKRVVHTCNPSGSVHMHLSKSGSCLPTEGAHRALPSGASGPRNLFRLSLLRRHFRGPRVTLGVPLELLEPGSACPRLRRPTLGVHGHGAQRSLAEGIFAPGDRPRKGGEGR